MKIIVLAGGLSTERDVSLSSSAGIWRKDMMHSFWMYLWDFHMRKTGWRKYLHFRIMGWIS